MEKIRRFIIQEYGFVMPPVRVTDRLTLPAGAYEIKVQGVTATREMLRPGRHLALVADDQHTHVPGEKVREPIYGAAARWVDAAGKDALVAVGVTVVEPSEVLATHLMETVQSSFARLMTRRAMRTIIDAFCEVSDPARAQANRRLVDDLVPDKVPHDLLQAVLRDLLSERVSIRNLPLILEAAAEARSADGRVEAICEHVRRRVAFGFVSKLTAEDGSLPVIQLGPDWDEALGGEEGQTLPVALATRLAGRVKAALDKAAEAGSSPILAVAAPRRRQVRGLLAAQGLRNPVLSFDEIAGHARPLVLGTA